MSNVVEFPTTEKPITEDEIDSPLRSISRSGKWDLRLCAHGEYRRQMAEHAIEGRDDKPKRQCSRRSRSRLC
jgi:hypothetical protein